MRTTVQHSGICAARCIDNCTIGIAASAHLAAVSPTCTYIEFLPRELADSRLRKDLCSVELPVVDGRIPLPTAPGLGVAINEEALISYRAK